MVERQRVFDRPSDWSIWQSAGGGPVAAADTVWTATFFMSQGFKQSWVLGYVALAVAACGFAGAGRLWRAVMFL